MKKTRSILILATALSVLAGTAHAACTVEYKAKRDNPLKLFHNVAVVPGP